MKRLLIIITLVLLSLPAISWSQGYEAVTITSASKALTQTTYLRSRSALCRVETAPIRYTVNGTTVPTALVGIVLYPLEWIILENTDQIRNFRGFATTATDASLKCFYFE